MFPTMSASTHVFQAFCLSEAFYISSTPDNGELTVRNSVMQNEKYIHLSIYFKINSTLYSVSSSINKTIFYE